MPAELFDLSSLFQWLAVAARLSAVLVFLPLPGFKSLPAQARILFALALASVLALSVPQSTLAAGFHGDFFLILAADLFTGVAIGLVATLVIEAFTFAGQSIAVQAGFSYASTIDPSNDTDTGVLPATLSLGANLLLFQTPLYAALIRALAAGLGPSPSRVVAHTPQAAHLLIAFSAHCLGVGLKLALPVIALLFLSDLCIGLFGRLQPQLQVHTLSFTLKLLGTMAAAAALMPAMRWLFLQLSNSSVSLLHAFTR